LHFKASHAVFNTYNTYFAMIHDLFLDYMSLINNWRWTWHVIFWKSVTEQSTSWIKYFQPAGHILMTQTLTVADLNRKGLQQENGSNDHRNLPLT